MIIRNILSDGNLDTKLNNVLNDIPEQLLFSKEHHLRHPAAIYNISFGRIISHLDRVLVLYKKSKSNKKHNKLMEEYMEFLAAINGYIDDIYHIFKCFLFH